MLLPKFPTRNRLSTPWSCMYTELRIWNAFSAYMTEWCESHFSDRSSQKNFDEVLTWASEFWSAGIPWTPCLKKLSSEAARRIPRSLLAALSFRVGLCLTALFHATGLRPKLARFEDSGSECEKRTLYRIIINLLYLAWRGEKYTKARVANTTGK